MSKLITFNAKAELDRMAAGLHDGSVELSDHTGFICDAVAEIADSMVSIYTSDNVRYALEHGDDASEAIAEGLAMGGRDYFEHHPGHDFRDYAAHVGACAEYVAIERAIYGELEDAVTYAVLDHLANTYGAELDRAAWDHVRESHVSSWDGNDERLGDLCDEAEELYSSFLEGDEEDE